MNDPDNIIPSATAEYSPVKDKRWLVLFLFGALLLVLDLLTIDTPPPTYTYAVAARAGESGWQLVRDASVLPRFGLATDNETEKYGVQKKQFISILNRKYEFPPELFLFTGQALPINQADARALQLLPGIGPHLAQEIIATRQRNGRFTGPDDLDRVKGIGPVRLKQLQPLVSFQ